MWLHRAWSAAQVGPYALQAAIAAVLRQFIDPQGSAELEVKALACSGPTVLTERIDRFVDDGRIAGGGEAYGIERHQ